jgi:hypothetical protein
MKTEIPVEQLAIALVPFTTDRLSSLLDARLAGPGMFGLVEHAVGHTSYYDEAA